MSALFSFVPPAGHFSQQLFFCASGGALSANSGRKYPKNASRNPWFLHFLWRVQELLPKSCRSRELTYFYSRCRCIGSLKERAVLPWETDRPSGKRNISSTRVGAAAGLLLSQFPLRPITNETLESKGSLETIGFKRRFLHTFCCCWQKVCRRRHKKGVTAGKSRPSETAKKNCKGYYGSPRVLRTLAMTLLNVSK